MPTLIDLEKARLEAEARRMVQAARPLPELAILFVKQSEKVRDALADVLDVLDEIEIHHPRCVQPAMGYLRATKEKYSAFDEQIQRLVRIAIAAPGLDTDAKVRALMTLNDRPHEDDSA